MLTQILLTTVLLPIVLGIAISLLGTVRPTVGTLLTALLIPLAAAVISVSIEGFPPLPPVAAKQKLPVLLLCGGVAFAVFAIAFRQFVNRMVLAIASVVALAVPSWWLGRNVLAANATKAATLAIVLAIVAVTLATLLGSRKPKSPPAALPASLLAAAIGTALTAIMGGYIGMAQMNGALAALFGGWLIVRYVAYLRGDDKAFELQGAAAFSFIWTAAMGLTMTVLLAPSASPVAIVLTVLPGAVFTAVSIYGSGFERQPRVLRPLAIGALTALPAIAAITTAVLASG